MQVSSLKRLPAVVLGLCLVCLTAACGGGNVAPENVYIADEADSGQTVTMSVGDVLQVMLEENQSTGYSWSIVTNDGEVLRPSAQPAYEVDSDAEGAGGRVTFVFDAAAPGTRYIAENVPGAKLVVIPQASHIANIEQPEAFNRALREFLSSPASARA